MIHHISFIKENKQRQKPPLKSNHQTLCLLDPPYQNQIFSSMAKLFTISTNNSSGNFNIEMIKDSSSTVSKFIADNPQELQFHLNIDDDLKVMKKFEEIYQGKFVTFNKNELEIAKQIIELLNLTKCFLTNVLFHKKKTFSENKIIIDQKSFNDFLQNDSLKTFTIITNSKKYKCNIFGVFLSNKIRQFYIQNPFLNEYIYNYEDKQEEFQIISDIFNFKNVNITENNIYLLKKISTDLEIDVISNDFIKNYEKVEKLKTDINLINELFELLYNIKGETVLSVAASIENSIWSKTEENVQELSAFIIQVVNTDILLHHHLADMIFELDKKANDTNKLDILVPFIVNNLMHSFGETIFICSFIFKLFKKGIISKEEIINQLKIFFRNQKMDRNISLSFQDYLSNKSFDNEEEDEDGRNNDNDDHAEEDLFKSSAFVDNFVIYLYLWFLPEIIEIGQFDKEFVKEEKLVSFISTYLPDRIEHYKQMRESGEPDDEITKALRKDDVEQLKLLMSQNKCQEKFIVPPNIYENFVPNGETNYLNYAAAYGSINCFKYLLNVMKCNQSTFSLATFGCNIEIIKIVSKSINNTKLMYESEEDVDDYHDTIINDEFINASNFLFYENCLSKSRSSNKYKFLPSIIKHQNNIFNWIIEKKITPDDIDDSLLNILVTESVQNGNIHSLIEIINKGFILPKNLIYTIFQIACKKGFYRLSKIIFRILNKNNYYRFHMNSNASVSFDNLSIFKFSLNLRKTQNDIEKAFIFAVLKDNRNIIRYYFEQLVKIGFKFRNKSVYNSLNISSLGKSSDLFCYLVDQFKKTNDLKLNNSKEIFEILSNMCAFGNIDAVKTITDSIITSSKNEPDNDINNPELDFTYPFHNAVLSDSIEICQYFLDKKVFIDFNQLSLNYNELSSVKTEAFSMMIDNSSSFVKKKFLHFYFIPAIESKNYSLVEFLLKNNAKCEKALFTAVQCDDLVMVSLILKYRASYYINKTSENGTALCIAVSRNELKIVKALLSVDGVNPSLCNKNGETPLILAFPNVELMKPILDFYGDNFIFQTEQVHSLLKRTFHFLSSNPEEKESIAVLDAILKIKNFNPNEIINDENLLIWSCKNNNINIFKNLIKLEKIDLNAYIPTTGDTPLIITIKNHCYDIFHQLIKDPRTNVNAKNFENQTALSTALLHKQVELIDDILNSKKFDPTESHIDEAFYLADDECQMKLLNSKQFEINMLLIDHAKPQKNDNFYIHLNESNDNFDDSSEEETNLPETVLNYAVRTNKLQMVDYIIHHQSFDREKSDLKTAIFVAIKNDYFDVFKLLLSLLNDEINEYKDAKMSILYCAIACCQVQMTSEILNHPHFDCAKNSFFENFCLNLFTIEPNSFEIMKLLYKYATDHGNLIDLNALSSFGETVFTSIYYTFPNEKDFSKITEFVNFLLENGTDPNIPNKKGKYPLEHAIQLKSVEFVRALMNSNKIDFTKRIKSFNNKTFLHLAAILQNPEILKEFLDRNVIDINSTDDLGETPLMSACRFRRKESVVLLFEKDNLDYLHCNKKDEDALQITQNLSFSNDTKIESKEEYRQQILDNLESRETILLDSEEYEKNYLSHYLSSSDELFKEKSTFEQSKNLHNVLHFVDNSSSVLSEEDDEHNDFSDDYNYDDSNQYNSEKDISLNDYSQITESQSNHSSTADSSVMSLLALEGISSFGMNSKRSPNIRRNPKKIVSSPISLGIENTAGSIKESLLIQSKKNRPTESPTNINKKHNNEDNNNNNNTSSKLQDDSSENHSFQILPSLHSNRKKKVSSRMNLVSSNDRDEISKHPLNKTKEASEEINFSSSLSKLDSGSKTTKSDENKQVQKPASNQNISPRLAISKIKRLQKRSEKGDSDAQYSLAVCYSLGKDVPKDREKAFKYYLMASEQGNMHAQYSAATCYSYGKGTEKDKCKAFELYMKAAQQGFDKAQFAVGHFYEFGQGGVEKNHEKAVEWYQKAADQGHEASIEALNYE